MQHAEVLCEATLAEGGVEQQEEAGQQAHRPQHETAAEASRNLHNNVINFQKKSYIFMKLFNRNLIRFDSIWQG